MRSIKQQYTLYNTDPCTLIALDFSVFAAFFFIKKQVDFPGTSLAEGSRNRVLCEMIEQIKSALQPSLYQAFVTAALNYGTFGMLIRYARLTLIFVPQSNIKDTQRMLTILFLLTIVVSGLAWK